MSDLGLLVEKEYLRNDIYFCLGCCQFHDVNTDLPVHVPGVDKYYDPFTGKTYKVRLPSKKVRKYGKSSS